MKHPIACLLAISLAALSPTLFARDLDIDGDGMIEIYTLEDLDEIRNNLDGSSLYGSSEGCVPACYGFELMAPLDFDTNGSGALDDGDMFYNNGQGWVPIGSPEAPFTATFHGNNHELRNLSIARSDMHIGLFGFLSGGVAFLRVVNASISNNATNSTYNIGILAGQSERAGVMEVFVQGEITSITSTGGTSQIGGIIGYAGSSHILRCIADVDISVSGDAFAGGIAGQSFGGSGIDTSYANGSVSHEGGQYSFAFLGGLAGSAEYINGSYASNEVTSIAPEPHYVTIGGVAALSSSSLSLNTYWNSDLTTDTAGIEGPVPLTTSELNCPTDGFDTVCEPGEDVFWLDWTLWLQGNDAEPPRLRWFMDVDYDNDGLIEIDSLADLDEMRNDPSGQSLYGVSFGCQSPTRSDVCYGYELVADLDFDTNRNGVFDEGDMFWNDSAGWQPIGDEDTPFYALFEGNFHSISNLNINRPEQDDVGLFGFLYQYEYDYHGNLAFDGRSTSVVGGDRVGILAGRLIGGYLQNLAIRHGTVTGNNTVGGVVGFVYDALLLSTYGNTQVTAQSSAGGVAGALHAYCHNCYASGSVTATAGPAGGIAGSMDGSLFAVYARNQVSAPAPWSGGLSGEGRGAAGYSYWDTESTGQANSGPYGESSLSTLGLTTEQMRCPVVSDDTTCQDGTIIYEQFEALGPVWDFGTRSQYPVLLFNGVAFHDQDGDAVADEDDAFPNNIAASIDADGDGLPDAWDNWCDSTCQLASGLTLDHDPTNVQPVANAGGPYAFTLGDTLQLDASGSTDLDGAIALYEWDLDNDGVFDDALGMMPEVSGFFSNAGDYLIAVRVTDDDDATAQADTVIVVTAASKDDDGGAYSLGWLLLSALLFGRRQRTPGRGVPLSFNH